MFVLCLWFAFWWLYLIPEDQRGLLNAFRIQFLHFIYDSGCILPFFLFRPSAFTAVHDKVACFFQNKCLEVDRLCWHGYNKANNTQIRHIYIAINNIMPSNLCKESCGWTKLASNFPFLGKKRTVLVHILL